MGEVLDFGGYRRNKLREAVEQIIEDARASVGLDSEGRRLSDGLWPGSPLERSLEHPDIVDEDLEAGDAE